MLTHEGEDPVIDRVRTEVQMKPMNRGFGPVLTRNSTPGTAGLQNIQNPVEESAFVSAGGGQSAVSEGEDTAQSRPRGYQESRTEA